MRDIHVFHILPFILSKVAACSGAAPALVDERGRVSGRQVEWWAMGDAASPAWRPPAAALDPPAEPVPIQPRTYTRPQVRARAAGYRLCASRVGRLSGEQHPAASNHHPEQHPAPLMIHIPSRLGCSYHLILPFNPGVRVESRAARA